MERALLTVWPKLGRRLAFSPLGELPTPVESGAALVRDLGVAAELYVKRDDLTSPVYGGNKVRTLEVLFARALELGARRIFSTGAYGSNHAVATVLHAPRVGLEPGVVLFPQPHSAAAVENLRVSLAKARAQVLVPHWSALPFAMYAARRSSQRAGVSASVMVPGGATPLGALGYVSAALELAEQIHAKALPAPRVIVVGVGSTCTSAGLTLGLNYAARLGLGFSEPPLVCAVRVSPWPVTAKFRVVSLARRTSSLLAELSGDPSLELDARTLSAHLDVDGRFLGAGYGRPSAGGLEASARFVRAGLPPLDTTYSGKAAAGLLALLRSGQRGPVLFWSTKSTAPLPEIAAHELEGLPARPREFIQG